MPHSSSLPRLAAAEGLLLFGVKKNQKTPAENFSFKASGAAGAVPAKKFIRPDLSRTEIRCQGLAGVVISSKAPRAVISSGAQRSREIY